MAKNLRDNPGRVGTVGDLFQVDASPGASCWVDSDQSLYEAKPYAAGYGPSQLDTTPVNWIPSPQDKHDDYQRTISAITCAAPDALLDIYLGENITDPTALATWPGVFPGGAPLTAAGAGSAFAVGVSSKNGRKYVSSTTSADRAITRASGTCKAVMVVYRHYGQAPAASQWLASFTGSVYPLTVTAGQEVFAVGAGVGNPSHSLDGKAGDALPIDEHPHVCMGVCAGNVTPGLLIGGYTGFNFSVTGEIFAVVPFVTVPTEAQADAIAKALMRYYWITQARGLFVDGNSIANGYLAYPWANRVASKGIFAWNIAINGRTLPQVRDAMAASFATRSLSALRDSVYFFYEDVNSLAPGAGNMSADQVLALNWEICAIARASGKKVILSTCMPSTASLTTAQSELNRQLVNRAKRENWPTYAEALIDWAAMPEFSDSANVKYFRDALHPTDFGYWLMAAKLRQIVADLP